MKKSIFVTIIMFLIINISVIAFSQVNDKVNIPVYITIPSYAVIESVDTNQLNYELDLATPENASEEVKVRIVTNTNYDLKVEFLATQGLDQRLVNVLNEAYKYSVDTNSSQTGVIERSVSVGFNFQQVLNENPELKEALLALGPKDEKIGTFVFTVAPVI
ncbi:hypothetical protein [Petrotoga sp. 9PWA.NaAc.5.4]|uniref:hypothetical protein n=1 Tax=Petrotoga sp. 9PWA.NaAc.5.4 TaxID=1434328 RepID=UPI000CBB61EA|nr:hypothetical protein [Petrotoga sp. 9PWA.NaAc.5.4]PNR92584.1 hypothetical protein X924_09910 [Petrotoga sp. 9PWA.NaAc.5.4]